MARPKIAPADTATRQHGMKLVMERFCRPGGPNPTLAQYFSDWASPQGEGGRERARTAHNARR